VDDALLQCYHKEVPVFEDTWDAVFELDLHYDLDKHKVEVDSDQDEAAMIFNDGARGEQYYTTLCACHEYVAFV
jgi:hypothetical protein